MQITFQQGVSIVLGVGVLVALAILVRRLLRPDPMVAKVREALRKETLTLMNQREENGRVVDDVRVWHSQSLWIQPDGNHGVSVNFRGEDGRVLDEGMYVSKDEALYELLMSAMRSAAAAWVDRQPQREDAAASA